MYVGVTVEADRSVGGLGNAFVVNAPDAVEGIDVP
jgi:hypothetical protein